MNRDEEEANHVAGQGDADEKYWKCLESKISVLCDGDDKGDDSGEN